LWTILSVCFYKRYLESSLDSIIAKFSSDYKKNNAKVNYLVENIFSVDIDVYNIKYLRKQVAQPLDTFFSSQ